MNRDTYIIIPVYNEAAVIAGVVKRLRKRFANVVCVDDGSSDDSAAVIAGTGARLVRHLVNAGQGAALQTGLEYALQRHGINYFVTFDADGQHRVEDAERMVAELRSGTADIVLGSRFLDDSTELDGLRRLVLRLATGFGNISSGAKLTDAHNGLRAFNRAFADTLEITMPDMAHASELTALVGRSGLRYKEVPVTVEYTEYSRGKGQPLTNGLNILFDLLLAPGRSRK